MLTSAERVSERLTSIAPAQAWRRDAATLRWSVASHGSLLVAALSAIAWVAPVLGLALPPGAVAILGAGALAVRLSPGRAIEVSAAAGAALLIWLHPAYAAYHIGLVGALYLCRRRSWQVALVLVVLALVVPKALFALFFSRPSFYQWLNEPSLASAIFITTYWWRETRDGRLPTEEEIAPARWALLFFFPFHAAYAITFGPRDLWAARRVEAAPVLRGLAACLGKAAALVALRRLFPHHGYAARPAHALLQLSVRALWGVVALNYLGLVLSLSGIADLAVVVGRLYGWRLPSPFRWTLLAWNPVELWRRWGIYTRRFLLKTVYFPLGGSDRHRIRNVMLTFLASALLLHTGWLGSRYWRVGAAGWRDHGIYFLVQGLAVCACLLFWRRTGKDPGSDRALRWSWARVPATVATQAFSAWVHILILAPSISLPDRWRLMIRCLGF